MNQWIVELYGSWVAMSVAELYAVAMLKNVSMSTASILPSTPPDMCCRLMVFARRSVFSDLVFWNEAQSGLVWLQTILLNDASVLISFSFKAGTNSGENQHWPLNDLTARPQTVTECANKNESSAGESFSISVYSCIQNCRNLSIITQAAAQRNRSLYGQRRSTHKQDVYKSSDHRNREYTWKNKPLHM